MSSDQEKRMAQYLLGQLPEKEQADLEGRYLADDVLFEELLALEDDLRDAYARGELSTADREAFERRLLTTSSQRRQQEFARTLSRYVDETHTQEGSPPGQLAAKWKALLGALGARPHLSIPALSMTMLFLLAGSWWLGRRSVQPLEPAHVMSQTGSDDTPGAGGPTTGGLGPETRTMAFVLRRSPVRGIEESKLLVIPPGIDHVRLEARVEANFPRYEAVLRTAEGKRIFSKGDLEAQAMTDGKRIPVSLSSSLLPPGDYILTLRGVPTTGSPETVTEYTFRVGKR